MKDFFLELTGAYIDHFTCVAPPLPETIQLEITNRCNLRCGFCPRGNGTSPVEIRDMTLDELDILAPLLRAAGVVELTGFGDALCHPNPIEMLTRLRSFNLSIFLTTNGQKLNEQISRNLVEKELIDQITFSIDASTKQTYRRLRGGNFDALVHTLNSLTEIKKAAGSNAPRLWLSFLGMKSNIEELPAFIELCAKVGGEKVILQHLMECESFKDESCLSDFETTSTIIEKTAKAAAEFGILFEERNSALATGTMNHGEGIKACPLPFDHAFVQADGRLRACAMAWEQLEMGNAFKDGIASIWSGKAYRKLRTAIRSTCHPEACLPCQYFPTRRLTPFAELTSAISFGPEDDRQLGLGWHPPEPIPGGGFGRWTRGEATAFLAVANRSALYLELSNHPKAPEITGEIRLDLWDDHDKEPAASSVHSLKTIGGLTLPLPGKGDLLSVTVALQKSWDPGAFGLGAHRNLGLFLSKMEMR